MDIISPKIAGVKHLSNNSVGNNGVEWIKAGVNGQIILVSVIYISLHQAIQDGARLVDQPPGPAQPQFEHPSAGPQTTLRHHQHTGPVAS